MYSQYQIKWMRSYKTELKNSYEQAMIEYRIRLYGRNQKNARYCRRLWEIRYVKSKKTLNPHTIKRTRKRNLISMYRHDMLNSHHILA
jgi:hypothetical protein